MYGKENLNSSDVKSKRFSFVSERCCLAFSLHVLIYVILGIMFVLFTSFMSRNFCLSHKMLFDGLQHNQIQYFKVALAII